MFDVSSQYPAYIIWDGTKTYDVPTQGSNAIGFTFRVTADITADAVLTVQEAKRIIDQEAGTCTVGSYTDIKNIDSCWTEATDGAVKITIPIGTKAGSECRANLLCKPEFFIHMVSTSGDTAKVTAAVTLYT